jgi:3-oxoacyl-[acyl-carrier-protein] synthase III
VQFRHTHARISAVVGLVPSTIRYFDEERANYSHDEASTDKLKALMGYGQHRLETSGRTISDYAVDLLRHLAEAGITTPSEIDAIFVVTQTPDYPIPPTSCVIHGRGRFPPHVYCVDITDGCTGYVKGLNEACAFLAATSARRVLLIAGDILSPRVSPYDRNSFPLIGDAVTATVIDRTDEPGDVVVRLEADGTGYDKLIIPAGGTRTPMGEGTRVLAEDAEGNRRSLEHLCMNGRDVFAFTQTVVPRFVADYLQSCERSVADYHRMYFHQANAFILERLRKKFNADAVKMPDNVIREFGNSSAGTIPMLIASDAAPERRRCLLVGFGVGLQWGLVDVVIDPNVSLGVKEF